MFYSLKNDKLIDPTRQGLKDFINKTIRFVGKPQDRLKEDRLRAFRFYRFVYKLKVFNFIPDNKSLKAVRESINVSYNIFLKLEKEIEDINQKLLNFKFEEGQEEFKKLLEEKSILDKKFIKFSKEFKAVAPSRLINEIERIVL